MQFQVIKEIKDQAQERTGKGKKRMLHTVKKFKYVA